jgi:hypothetical protein
MSVGEFDTLGLWEVAGYTSTHAWLKDQGFHPRDAFDMVKLARKLRRLPATAAAWVAGDLTGGQVRIIGALVIDRHVPLFAEHERELVPTLAALTVDETLRVMRLWRDRADALDAGPEPRDEPCIAHLSPTLDDRGVLHASLDAEGFALWTEALRLADSDDLGTPAPRRRGASLTTIASFFIKHQNAKTPRRHVPHIKLLVDARTLGTDHVHGYDEATGMTLRPETIDRILCDCVMHRVVMADGIVLDYGRAVKEPPPELAHAVAARDQGCRWKSCDRPVGWCDVHHVREYVKHFGPTAIGNLVLVCEKHHTVLHRRGWSAKLHANGAFEVTSPWKQSWTTHPPGALQQRIRPPGDPFEDDGSPLEDHLVEYESVFGARLRINALINDARTARAIAALTRLPRRGAA